jgi:hypothetical protein
MTATLASPAPQSRYSTRRPVAELRLHAQAEIVPTPDADSYAALRASIAADGVEVPLEITAKGVVLDGRGRLAIARELGVEEVPVCSTSRSAPACASANSAPCAGATSTGSGACCASNRHTAETTSNDRRARPGSAPSPSSLFLTVMHALDALAARALERGTYAPEELLFQTETGGPFHPSNLNRRVWQPALRHAKLAKPDGKPRYRFHNLRHTCISRLVAAGADIKLVQTIAGHSNPVITLKRYSHLLDHRLTQAAEQFDPAAPVGSTTRQADAQNFLPAVTPIPNHRS